MNAAGTTGDTLVALPADARPHVERVAFESLRVRAHTLGVRGARLFGHTAPERFHAADAAHALLGVASVGLAGAGLEVGLWSLLAVVVSAGLRAAGVPALDRLLPRRPSWSLVLRPPGPATRRVYAAVADRDVVVPVLPRVTLGALLVNSLALAGGPWPMAVACAGLAGVGAAAAWYARPARPERGGPETLAAEALLHFAARVEDAGTAVWVSSGASTDGHGVATLLDWRAIAPGQVDVYVVGAPDAAARAAAALARDGWRAHVLPPADLRSLA